VNPNCVIPPFITQLTGISWQMVKDKPAFAAFVPEILAAMSGRVFVAHNASFDWKFVNAELARERVSAPVCMQLCTVRLARAMLPELPRRSLDNVAFALGVEIEARHRAAGDALATARILQILLKRAAGIGLTTWPQVAEYARLNGGRRHGGAQGSRRSRYGNGRP
jgi:DNA polymerase-3 subunit epsilon